MSTINGFDHWTLTVSDLDRAATFYCDVLGWHPVDQSEPADESWGPLPDRPSTTNTRRFVRDGQRIELAQPEGTTRRRRTPQVNHLGLSHMTVATDNTDQLMSTLDRRGVNVRTHTRSSFIPGQERPGNQFLFEDPDGNIIETYESGNDWNSFGIGDAEPGHTTGIAHLSHWSLCIKDPTTALPFYQDLLGWEQLAVFDWEGLGPSTVMDVGPATLTTWLLGASNQRIEVVHFAKPQATDDDRGSGSTSGLSHMTITVTDVTEADAELAAAGAEPCITRGRLGDAVVFHDPDGNLIRGVPLGAAWT